MLPVADIQAALEASRATRAEHRRTPADDPQRRSDLEATLGTLHSTWTPELRDHVRTGPQIIGRSGDEVRALGRERRKEIARVRSMLNPSPGTPRQEPPAITFEQMSGHVGKARQVIYGLAGQHDVLRRVLGGGQTVARKGGKGRYLSMRQLNDETQLLLDELDRTRLMLTTAYGRYQRQPFDTYKSQDQWDQIAEQVAATREEAAMNAEALRESINRRAPVTGITRPRETWTQERIERMLRSFHANTGRWPTAAELRSNAGLPHYTQLGRLFGPAFLGRLDEILG